MINTEKLHSIAANAAYLSERLALLHCDKYMLPLTSEERSLAKKYLSLWRKAIGGSQDKLDKRIKLAGWSMPQVLVGLSRAPLVTMHKLPEWADILQKTSHQAILFPNNAHCLHPLCPSRELPFPTQASNPIPFEELLLPFIRVARFRLIKEYFQGEQNTSQGKHTPITFLSDAAYLQTERLLLLRLNRIAANTLGLQFAEERSVEYSVLPMFINKEMLFTDQGSKNDLYLSFVEKHLETGMLLLFDAYPVLARLLSTAVLQWVQSLATFIQHLQSDSEELNKLLHGDKSNSLVIADIKGDISDYHNDGRSVLLLSTSHNVGFVYKPRSVSSEKTYNELLAWCNQRALPLQLKTLRVIDRGSYGWVLDYVTNRPCTDLQSVDRFYQRSGMLLCLAYVLGCNDLHHENIVACGEHPVILDVETLLHPHVSCSTTITDRDAEWEEECIADSVMRTGLLPRWECHSDNDIAYDISGLGYTKEQLSPWTRLGWKNINTNWMLLVSERYSLPAGTNLPIFQGSAVTPERYISAIQVGFGAMYRFLLRHRQQLLKDEAIQKQLESQTSRFIFRPTEVYGALLEKSLLPQNLTDGIARSLVLEEACDIYLSMQNTQASLPLMEHELSALLRMDIPYFTSKIAQTIINTGRLQQGYLQQGCLQKRGYNEHIKRLVSLNIKDLRFQTRLISGTFGAKTARHIAENEQNLDKHQQISKHEQNIRQEKYTESSIDFECLLTEQVKQIADKLASSALTDARGGAAWLGLQYLGEFHRYQYQTLGHSLYQGNTGIALFLSAYSALTGDNKYLPLVYRATRAIRILLQDRNTSDRVQLIKKMGIGGINGLGSIIYTYILMADFLEDDSWIESAALAASMLTENFIKVDRKFDIANGSAGLLLTLLKLYQKTGNSHLLELCCRCGEHLVTCQKITVSPIGRKVRCGSWVTLSGAPLTGFAHGAAGIAYALFRLDKVVPDKRWQKSAFAGIEFERESARVVAAPFSMSWCHGAPGILLSRAAMLEWNGVNGLEDEIEWGLALIDKQPILRIDHVCCGNVGLVEACQVLAKKMNRPYLYQRGYALVREIVKCKLMSGSYRLFANLSKNVDSPGFFQGLSGIGYHLLRVIYPEKTPCILLME